MKIFDTLKITTNNFLLTLKILLTYLLVIALVVGLATASMSITISSVANAINQTGVLVNIQSLIGEIFGNFNEAAFQTALQNLIVSVKQAVEIIPNFYSRFTMAYISFFVALALGKYLISYGNIPYYSCINEFMTTSARGKYTWQYFKKFKNSTIYGLLLIAITLPLDTLLVVGCIGLYLFVLAPLGVVGIIFEILSVILFFTIRMTMFSMWLPNLVSKNLGVIASLKEGLKQVIDMFWTAFLNNLVIVEACALILVPIVLFAPIIWSAIISLFVILYANFVAKSLNMTLYFSYNGLKYFTKPVKFDELNKKIV